MAVPKRKMSRSNTRSRRAQWKAEPVDLVPIRIQGVEHKVPRRLVRAYQRGLIQPD
ncbi:MAG TPA: 50S ribosomal protein L32 [Arachnia sp.]|jgi:large subunit ribosomal protein L32|nr:50S ribosomal protein L32 [Arachnia sp.]HMR13645.1 50S ribosomal protein L32 [Arachnia sp.]